MLRGALAASVPKVPEPREPRPWSPVAGKSGRRYDAQQVLELLAVAIAAAAAAGLTTLAVGRWRRRASEQPPRGRQPRSLERGEIVPRDVVAHLDAHYLVEGVAEVDEGAGRTTVIAQMLGDDGQRFLVVEPGTGRQPVVGSRREPSGAGQALPRRLQDGHFELALVGRIAARIAISGDIAEPPAGPCSMGRYEGPGERVVFVVLSGSRELFLSGERVTPESLVLMPAGGEDRQP